MSKNAKNSISAFYQFCKKKTHENVAVNFLQFIMDGDGKKPPNAPQIRPIENYWGILKMKVYEGNWTAQTRDHLIWCIKMKQKEIDQNIVIKMFDHLKGWVNMANQIGLQSLQKIWNELIFMFVIYSCQKIE